MMACCCTALDDLDDANDRIAEIEAEVRYAIRDLKQGAVSKAIERLNRMAPDPDIVKERRKEAELSGLLAEWQLLALPRPDFLTFAHKRRNLSRV